MNVDDSTTVTLTWTLSDNSEQDNYQIDIKSIHDQRDWKEFTTTSDEEVEIPDLYPGDQYYFRIAAKSGEQFSAMKTSAAVVMCK